MKSDSEGITQDVAHVARGMLMGGADIIPGVSGGTMALILGIYQRLVTAISRVDTKFLSLVKSRQWGAAAAHIDLRFLVALGLGVGTGIVVLGSLMHILLDKGSNVAVTCPITIAAFFGLIVASAVHVGRMIKNWSIATTFLVVFGALVAYTITGMEKTDVVPSKGFLFLCGMIAICAMILPGISGAFIMLLLGVYKYITEAIHGLKDAVKAFHFTDETWTFVFTLSIFASGCVVGILAFSKVLHWLLDKAQNSTMAVLCGFMIGSLRQLWPFQVTNDKFPALEYPQPGNVLADLLPESLINVIPATWVPKNIVIPATFNSLVVYCLIAMVAAFAFVLILEKIGSRGEK